MAKISDAQLTEMLTTRDRISSLERNVAILLQTVSGQQATPTAQPGPSHVELQGLRARIAEQDAEKELLQQRLAALEKPPIELEPEG